MKQLEAGDELAAEARKAHDGTRCDAFADGCECGSAQVLALAAAAERSVQTFPCDLKVKGWK